MNLYINGEWKEIKRRDDDFSSTVDSYVFTDYDLDATKIDVHSDGKYWFNTYLDFYNCKLYYMPYEFYIDFNQGTDIRDEDGKVKDHYLDKNDYYYRSQIWTSKTEYTYSEYKQSGVIWFSKNGRNFLGPVYMGDKISFRVHNNPYTRLAYIKLSKDGKNANDANNSYARINLSSNNSFIIDKDFVKTYADYGKKKDNDFYSGKEKVYVPKKHEMEIRPVFERIPASVHFISDKNKGYIKGFTSENVSEYTFSAHLGDEFKLEIQSVNGTYVPAGIKVTSDSSTEIIEANPVNKFSYTVRVTEPNTTIEVLYEQPSIRVAPDYALVQAGQTSVMQRGDVFTILDAEDEDIIKVGNVEDDPENLDSGLTMASTNTLGGEYNIELSPVKLNNEYIFQALPHNTPDGADYYYLPAWIDATGILDLEQGENGGVSNYRYYISRYDPERYKDMTTAVFGTQYAFKPLDTDAAVYYRFDAIRSDDIAVQNIAGGRIIYRNVSMFAKDGEYYETYYSAKGAEVRLNGLQDENGDPYITYADELGNFEFTDVKNMQTGMRYSATIKYKGQTVTTYLIGGARLLTFILDPYEILVPTNMQVIKNDIAVDPGNVYADTNTYDFIFDVKSNEGAIQPKDAYLKLYDNNDTSLQFTKQKN